MSETFQFDEISETAITAAIATYPVGKQASAVMPLLDIAQRQMARLTGSAWVPRPAMDEVARRLGIAPVRVYEIVTFYTMFNTRPIGKYHLQICTTTPCWLRGSDEIVKACQKISGIGQFGESSADGLFTLSEVECLGACVNAPMIQINDHYYEDLDVERVEKLLQDLKAGKALPPPGPTNGRHGTAPASGRTTLLETGGADAQG
jgi:NADH-quinone oxidoreductase subunit E